MKKGMNILKVKRSITLLLSLLVLLLVYSPISAQEVGGTGIQISGTVTSEDDREPLIGVSIRVKGHQQGTITDLDGNFKITVPDANSVLVVSYIGFETQEIKVGTRTSHNIVLHVSKNTELEEVVVIGYGSVQKKDLTGSVVSVKMGDIRDVPVVGVDQALQGRIPGADIMATTGEPGAPTSIRIRGTRSITATNEPLIVVDGVLDGVQDLADINAADIESISVLKDASSTAIYGSRGSNGVIIVTTKTGRKGKPSITFKSDIGFSDLPTKLDLMSGPEFAQYRNDYALMVTSDGYGDININSPLSDYPYPDPYGVETNTNWMDEITRTSMYQNYNVSLSGGSEKTTYFGSFGYNETEGIIKKSGLKRYSGRFNVNHQLFDWLKLGYSVNYTYRDQDKNVTDIGGTSWWQAAIYLSPLIKKDSEFNDLWYSGQTFDSPLHKLAYNKKGSKTHNTTHSLFAEINPTEHIMFRTQASYYHYNYSDYEHQSGKMPTRRKDGRGAYNNRKDGNTRTILSENTLTYKNTFNTVHNFDAMIGFTAQSYVKESLWVNGNGYPIDGLLWNNMGSISSKDNLTVGSNKERNIVSSYLARINYNYDQRYYFTATFRADGASNFAKNKKYGYFPSGAFKWTASNEEFLKDIKNIDEIALRLTAGRTGNSGIPNNRSQDSMGFTTGGYLFGGSQPLGMYPSRLASPNLTWETTDTYNLALDLSFFNSRLNITAEGYLMYTKDLLLDVQTPTHTGYSSKLVNIGKTSNKGIELFIDSRNIVTEDFSWSTTLNLSHNKQMVRDIGTNDFVVAYNSFGNNPYMVYGYVKGYPLNALWGFKFAGTWKSQEEIERNKVTKAYVSPTYYREGRPKYLDLDHNGVFNDQDLAYLGNSDPWLHGGLQNNFRYKNWNLSIFFNYSLGGKIYNLSERFLGNGSPFTNQYRYMLDAWHPVRNPNSDIPYAGTDEGVMSDRNVYDASYLRLKNVTLSYNFDLRKKTKNIIKDLRLSVSADNLFVLKDYNGFDPDVSTNSEGSTLRRVDLGAYPKQRTIVFSLQLQY